MKSFQSCERLSKSYFSTDEMKYSTVLHVSILQKVTHDWVPVYPRLVDLLLAPQRIQSHFQGSPNHQHETPDHKICILEYYRGRLRGIGI